MVAKWDVEGDPIIMLGETLPPILLQLKDKNKVPLPFPDAVRATSRA